MSSATTVRSDLEARALSQFDSLVEKGEIIWEPTHETKVEQEPFNVCQTVLSAYSRIPTLIR